MKSNEERIDELQADTVSNIETLAGRLKTELANVRQATVLNTQLKAELSRTQRDLDEARVLNGELAKTNDSLEADISRQGATRIPVPSVAPAHLVKQMTGGYDAGAGATLVPSSDRVPVELTVKFEKTPEQLRDLVLDELIKYKREIAEGVEYVKLNVSQLIKLVEGAVQENLRLCNSCGGDHRVDRDAAYRESLRIFNLLKDAQGSVCEPAPLASVALMEIVERERNDAGAAMHNRPGSHETAAYQALDRLLMKLRAATKF